MPGGRRWADEMNELRETWGGVPSLDEMMVSYPPAGREGSNVQPSPRQQNQSAPKTPPKSRLGSVVRGKIDKPAKIIVYGVEGIGKTTFAANAPSPIFLALEDGTSELDVARAPEIRSWSDVLEFVEELATSEHPYKTLVIDTLDVLESWCWSHICKRDRETSIESYGYGKGYNAALDEWRVLLAAVERMCAARGMGVVFIAHSWIKAFKDPESEGWDRYEMKLHAKAAGLLREWSDVQLFAQYETFVSKDSKTKRTRGVSSGLRVLRTTRTAAYDAKNRYNLPDTLPLDYAAFEEARRQLPPPETSLARIEQLLATTTDAVLIGKVRAAVEKANGDPGILARHVDTLKARLSITQSEQETEQKTEGEGASHV